MERKSFISLLTVAGIFLIMLAMSWNRWSDPLIDFGREVYVPWQISEGAVLYRDIASLNGPLSSYINGGLFYLFGPGLPVLIIFNLGLIILAAWLIYSLALKLGDRTVALFSVIAFLTLFAFGNYLNTGNYNFVAPYSHELVHGFILSLLVLLGLQKFLETKRRRWIFLAGISAGFSALTKPEIAIAIIPALFLGIVIWLFQEKTAIKTWLAALSAALAGIITPIIIAIFLFSSAIFGPYLALIGSASTNPFYQAILGADAPLANLAHALWLLVVYAAIFGGLIFLTKKLVELRSLNSRVAIGVAAALGGIIFFLIRDWNVFAQLLRPFPLIMLILIGWLFWKRTEQKIGLLAFSIFAFLLLGKIILNTKIFHYGFVLALPATLVIIISLGSRLQSTFLKIISASILIIFIVVGVRFSYQKYSQKTFLFQTKSDSLKVEKSGRTLGVQYALDRLKVILKPDDTIAVVPEGVMLNFLLRHKNPTPYIQMMPAELAVFGEARILESLKKSPPDYIALVDKNMAEYGYRGVGDDYGVETLKWIHSRYKRMELIGEEPFRGYFGIEILKQQ